MFAKKQELLDARAKVAKLLEVVGLKDINRAKRELLAILERRRAWVQKRIQSMAAQGTIHLYDEEEVGALKWVINQVINQEAELKRLRGDIKQLRAEPQERGREKNGFQGFVAKN